MITAVVVIPLWIWPVLAIACLLVLAWHDERRILRKQDNFRAIEAERMARLNAAPLGNADRVYDWDRVA